MNTPMHVKQPGESRTIRFDFEGPPRKLLDGDSVLSITAVEAAAGIVVSGGALVGNVVTALASGGTNKRVYRVSCRVLTAQGETLELDVDVRIADGAN